MTTVPRITSPSVRGLGGRPTFQERREATPEAFGALQAKALEGLGQAIQSTGQELQTAFDKSELEDNERESKLADVEYARGLLVLNFGSNTAEDPGLFGLKGQAAVDAQAKHQEAKVKLRAEIEGRLSNSTVRDAFSLAADQRELRQFGAEHSFFLREREQANVDASEARMAVAFDTAVRFFKIPTFLAGALGVAAAEVNGEADRNSDPPEVRAAKLMLRQTTFVKGVFDAAIKSADFNAAADILDKHRKITAGAVVSEMEQALRTASVRIQAQELSKRARLLFPDDQAAQRQYIEDNAEGIVRDEALLRAQRFIAAVRLDEADKRRIVTEARADANDTAARKAREKLIKEEADLNQAMRLLNGAGGKEKVSYNNLPTDLLDRIPAKFWKGLEEEGRRIARGLPVLGDDVLFSVLMSMDTEKTIRVNLADTLRVLNDDQQKALVKRVTDARNGLLDPTQVGTFQDTINATMNAAKMLNSTKNEKAKRGRVILMYMEALEQARIDAKGNLDIRERQKLATEIVSEMFLKGASPEPPSLVITPAGIMRIPSLSDLGKIFGSSTEKGFEIVVPKDKAAEITAIFVQPPPLGIGRPPTALELAKEYVLSLEEDE